MSLLLRHNPEAGGLILDSEGYVGVDDLLAAIARNGHSLDRQQLTELVETNNKKRFVFDERGAKIRAAQGHSVEVDLGLEPVTPPDSLYHGTVQRVIEPVKREGLKPGARLHVHLSGDRETAIVVGRRRGVPFVLTIDAARMDCDGHLFYLAQNGVWLTDMVPPQYIIGWGL